MLRLIRESLAPATQSLYCRVWSRFVTFCTQCLGKKATLPISVSVILLFIAHLHKEKLSAASITSYMSGLAYVHKIQGLVDPTRHFVIAKVLAGARRVSSSHDVRLPITMPVLKALVHAVPSVCLKVYDCLMLQCMFSLAFHAFLRIGEIAAKSVKERHSVLQLSDIHISKRGSEQCTITLCKFKHSGGQGPHNFVLKRARTGRSKCCPVRLLVRYLKRRGNAKGALFNMQNGKPFLRRHFDAQLKSVLQFSGYSTDLYKGHSSGSGPLQRQLQMAARMRKFAIWVVGVQTLSGNIYGYPNVKFPQAPQGLLIDINAKIKSTCTV